MHTKLNTKESMLTAEQPSFDELRELLSSWNVSELLPLCQDEAINIEELQMMKRHQLGDLLRNFRYGTRIRFEHHLERWRRWLNLPLQGAPHAHCSGCRCVDSPYQPQNNRIRVPNDGSQQQDDMLDEIPSLPEACVRLNEMDSLPLPSPLVDQSDLELGNTETVPHMLEPPRERSNERDCDDLANISVLSILQASGSRAQPLLASRGQNAELLPEQRILLIQLICGYYSDNKLHLTLQRSHLLEREILALYPKEQLRYYRTERRGKIYVKFTNMKRFKRQGYEAKGRRMNYVVTKKEETYSGD